jgi:hypothetical protein
MPSGRLSLEDLIALGDHDGGKSFDRITPEAMKSAITVTEKNPTWKWSDQDPHPPID